jgi:hypothetical protein
MSPAIEHLGAAHRLPHEVLSQIVSYLYKPLPPPWLDIVPEPQRDLAACMRVSSVSRTGAGECVLCLYRADKQAFNAAAAPILYREPVVRNYMSFALGLEDAVGSVEEGKSSSD